MPLCNYLGMMLVGLVPDMKLPAKPTKDEDDLQAGEEEEDPEDEEGVQLLDQEVSSSSANELVRRQASTTAIPPELEKPVNTTTPTGYLPSSLSTIQLCVLLNVFLDFAGCVFSNIGLSMAGSGIYQVIYSSVVCWSALMSRIVLKRIVGRDEWIGIATVTFGLAFSALGESSDGKNAYIVLMGSLNTFIGAGFYGATYVAGEFTLNLPEKPSPRELCVKIGTTCVGIIAVYMVRRVEVRAEACSDPMV